MEEALTNLNRLNDLVNMNNERIVGLNFTKIKGSLESLKTQTNSLNGAVHNIVNTKLKKYQEVRDNLANVKSRLETTTVDHANQIQAKDENHKKQMDELANTHSSELENQKNDLTTQFNEQLKNEQEKLTKERDELQTDLTKLNEIIKELTASIDTNTQHINEIPKDIDTTIEKITEDINSALNKINQSSSSSNTPPKNLDFMLTESGNG